MEKIISSKQVANLCGVAASTIQHWENKGCFHSFKTIGGHRRFYATDIINFLEKKGRKIDLNTINNTLKELPKKDNRNGKRIKVEYMVKLELLNNNPENKFSCTGKLVDLSKKGFAIKLDNTGLSEDIFMNLVQQYTNVKIWLLEDIPFLKSPLNGKQTSTVFKNDSVRIGVKFNLEQS